MPRLPKGRKNDINFQIGNMEIGKPKKGNRKSRDKKSASTMDDISEKFKIDVEVTIKALQNDCDKDSHIFPNWLSNNERKYVHDRCKHYGLKSKSHGKDPNRCIQISLVQNRNTKVFMLDLNNTIVNLLQEVAEYPDCHINSKPILGTSYMGKHSMYSRLTSKCKVSVPPAKHNSLTPSRVSLPIYTIKSKILEMLNTNQVLIISSETGSGKTTQIPQYILEEAHMKNQTCKIICTQPRRISTISVAERVAAERGEDVGYTVGYQIKLETKVGPNTALIYCTNGVLLRTFMCKDKAFLKEITHIILDEVHERDKSTDILLICLKECLLYNPSLKLILMSATLDIQMFMNYFNNADSLHVTGRNYNITQIFLDEIWNILGYNKSLKSSIPNTNSTNSAVYDKEEMNAVITRCMSSKDQNDCVQLLQLILSENAYINHQTPESCYTPLIAAAACGNMEIVAALLNMGADPSLASSFSELTAAGWANREEHQEVYNLISNYESFNQDSSESPIEKCSFITSDSHVFLRVNFDLIVELVTHIHKSDAVGTILIFFPGYEDIITCMQHLTSCSIRQDTLKIICLHSSMPTTVRKSVFHNFVGRQKIILSTNIAETSITIPDVVYVIDTGLAKESTYDSISDVCQLQKGFISRASVAQRCGRAGRTQHGCCYHLYSKQYYNSLVADRTPEILCVPLYEICLQSKLLSCEGTSIADFLSSALDSPSQLAIDRAINGLIALGALNDDEELTLLGQQLLQLSLEPRLGKMLIYSVFLKCLDPVLTIVACLSHKEPFNMPSEPGLKKLATEMQKKLAGDSLSDHYGLIKAYQTWQNSKTQRTSECKDYYISGGAMEVINATRSQLLSQLRAIGFVDTRTRINGIQDLNINSNKWAVIKAALAVGCYPNLAFVKGSHVSTRTENKVRFNTTSTLHDSVIPDYQCVIYEELSKIGTHHTLRCCTIVTPLTIALMCGQIDSMTENYILMDNWIEFQHPYSNLIKCRNIICSIIKKKIAFPGYPFNEEETYIFKNLTKMLVEEDNHHELINPPDVGVRPKMFNSNPWFNDGYSSKHTMNSQRPVHTFNRGNPTIYRNLSDTSAIYNSLLNGIPNCEQGTSNTVATPVTHISDNNSTFNKFHTSISPFRTASSINAEKVRQKVEASNRVYSAAPSIWCRTMKSEDSRPTTTYGFPRSRQTEPQNSNTFYSSTSTSAEQNMQFVEQRTLSNNAEYSLPTTLPYVPDEWKENRFLDNAEMLASESMFTLKSPTPCDLLLDGLNPHSKAKQVQSYLSNMIAVPENSKFFIIRPLDEEMFNTALRCNTWMFSSLFQNKILKLLHGNFCVFLLFSIKYTNDFQGLAKLVSSNNAHIQGTCMVEWLSTKAISFNRVEALCSLYSNGVYNTIYKCVTEEEVNYNIGQGMYKMFFTDCIDNYNEQCTLGNLNFR